jgi:uncharacterized protein involved in outer membrane biogenesis
MLRRLAWILGGLLVLAIALAAIGVRLIDTPAVRAAIQARIAEALGGQVGWEALELRFLPAPHGELRRMRLEIPGALSARAETVDVYLRLWPLLRGNAEIASVSVLRPEIRLAASSREKRDEAPLEPVAAYRQGVEPVVRALRRFAPQTEVRIEGAAVDVEAARLQLRELSVVARTRGEDLELRAEAASNYWKRLQVRGRIAYADLAAQADVEVEALAIPEPGVPPATLRAQLRTDARTSIEAEIDGALGNLVPGVKAKLRLPAGQPPALTARLADIDLAAAAAIARRRLPGLDAIESIGGRLSADVSATLGEPWQVQGELAASGASLRLAVLPWKLAPQSARIHVTRTELRLHGVHGSIGESSISNAEARLELGTTLRLADASGRATLRLEQWFPWLRERVAALQEVTALSGAAEVELRRLALRFDRPAEADYDVVVKLSGASAGLKALPWKVSPQAAQIHATRGTVHISGLRGSIGDSVVANAEARLDFGKAPRLAAASGRATLRLEQWFPWLRERIAGLQEISALSGAAEVELSRLALRFDRPAEADYEARVTPRDVSAALKALPAPVGIASGSLRVDPARLHLDGLAAAMLDARVLVSGTVAMKGPRFELSLAEGMAGEKLVQWALARAQVPAHLEPKTPLRFAAKRIAWAPDAPLDADASIEFEGGPALGVALAWQPGKLDLRRLAIKDARSDAVIAASTGGDLVQASFSGTLYGRSLTSMLRQPWGGLQSESAGLVRGKLLMKGDRKTPARSLAEGRLRIEALDLAPFVHAKAMLHGVDLSADGETLRIAQAQLEWEEQRISLSGDIRRTAQGPSIDARLESPGIVIDRLLPAADPSAAPAAAQATPEKAEQSMLAKLWQVPLPGRVDVNVGFVRYRHLEIAPLSGSMVLERERASLELKEARMCGVSLPLKAEATLDSVALSTVITMKDQPLAQAGHCLGGEALEFTGNADLRAELKTQGKPAELIRNLTGTAQAEVRDGRVKKFALLGNILSLRNIASPRQMEAEGFPYRRMTARGQFKGGEFFLEEGFFDSDAARVAASGRIDLLGANSRLDVLLGLLTTVDRVAGAIPIIGDVFGSTMLALPVSVSGDIRDPRVVPLGPRAVTDRLLGIFERTLKLPTKLMVPPSAGEAAPPPAR